MDKYLKHILALFAGIICLIIYIITLSPSLGFMDSGELAAVVYTFGVSHPTGYPLYLLLGYIVSHLPAGSSVIYKLNFFSAVTGAITVMIFFYTVFIFLVLLIERKKEKKNDGKKKKAAYFNENTIYYIAFVTSVCFGLSKTFWSNAVTNEVYGLHSMFLVIIIYFSLKIFSSITAAPLKLWMILYLMIGLSFSNHLTTVFVIPAVLYLLFLQYKASALNFKKIISYSFLIIPGFLLYGILMLASASGPFFNWSEPVTFSNLLYHVSGGDFGHLLQSDSGVFKRNIKIFGNGFFGEYALVSGITALTGYLILFKRRKELFIFLTLLILSSLIFAVNYNVRDVQNYFILLYITLGLTLSLGIFSILKYMMSKLQLTGIPVLHIAMIGLILIITGAAYNFGANNNSKNYIIEDFTLNIIDNLEPGSLFITYDWGYNYPAALYYQQVEGRRQDLKVIMIRFLAAPWYLNTLKKYYPDVYKNISKEAEDYISTYDPENTGNSVKLVNLVKAFIKNNMNRFPLYVSSDMMYMKDMPGLFNEFGWKPGPLCYRITAKSEPYDINAGIKSLDFNLRPFVSDDKEKRAVKISTAGMYYDFAVYHLNNNNKNAALSFINKSLAYENLPDAVKLKNQLINEPKNK